MNVDSSTNISTAVFWFFTDEILAFVCRSISHSQSPRKLA